MYNLGFFSKQVNDDIDTVRNFFLLYETCIAIYFYFI